MTTKKHLKGSRWVEKAAANHTAPELFPTVPFCPADCDGGVHPFVNAFDNAGDESILIHPFVLQITH